MRTVVRQGGAPPFRLRRARARTASAGRMCECTYIPRMVGWRIAPGPKLSTPRTRMFHLLSVLRHRRTRIALTAAVASLSLAALPAGAHAALVQGQPQNVQAATSTTTPSVVTTTSAGATPARVGPRRPSRSRSRSARTLTNTGPNQFRVCGYNAAGGWMRAYEVVAAACPATAAGAGAQDGWFRYVTANHSDAARRGSFNRWHLMDLQRFALVPLPTSLGGPAGAYTAWDTTWGTCLSDGGADMDCTQDRRRGDPRDEHPGRRREDDAGARTPRRTRSASRSPRRARARSRTARTRSSRSRTRTASTAAGRASRARRSPLGRHDGVHPQCHAGRRPAGHVLRAGDACCPGSPAPAAVTRWPARDHDVDAPAPSSPRPATAGRPSRWRGPATPPRRRT